MAFCQNCGKQIPDESTLCEACAAAAAPAAEPVVVAAQPKAAAQPEAAPAAPTTPAAPYFQPAYTAPPAAQPYAQPYAQPMRIPLSKDQLPPEYKPLGAWMYFLYSLLFSIPLVGFILLIVFSCGGTQNINLRNYARSYFCALVVGLVLGLIVLVLALVLGGAVFAASYPAVDMEDFMSMAIGLFR